MTCFVPLFKYPFNGLHLYISKHIGPQGMSHEWSIKDKSVIGVVFGLNRVKVWKYTSSPLYGLFCSQLQHIFKCLQLYIGTQIWSKWTSYLCSIKDKSVSGVDLGLNRVNVWKYTSSPLYGLIVSHLQYTFKCLEPYIGTHFGYKSNEYVYAMKYYWIVLITI